LLSLLRPFDNFNLAARILQEFVQSQDLLTFHGNKDINFAHRGTCLVGRKEVKMAFYRIRLWISFTILICAVAVLPALGQAANDGNDFTDQQKADFLMKAKVIKSKQTAKGVTLPYQVTLNDGTVTHDGDFQPIDEMKPQMQFADGHTEFNFKDSYKFNIAGYELAKLVGMDNMIPVTVERVWNGKRGSLSWWVPDVMMDEGDRVKKNMTSPDPDAWNKQMYKVRVFDELVYDTDPNLTNVLITKDWKIWRVDFSRAFRTWKKLKNPENLVMCDKGLLEKLKALNEEDLKNATKKYLSGSEIKGVMARRDLIVEQFNKMIAEKGEAAVLY
jgi:hypothetical protein